MRWEFKREERKKEEGMPPNTGDMVLVPEWGRSPGKGNAKSLQYSCLGNPTEKRNLAGYTGRGRRRVGHDFTMK